MKRMKNRCLWCGCDPLYVAYHDDEWGMPSHNDRHLYEMLVLEGAQAGLSWITVLRKRKHYHRAFAGFDARKVARYTERDLQRLLADPGIVRNRLKIESTIVNARRVLEMQEAFGSFDAFIWRYADGTPAHSARKSMAQLPASTRASDAMSKDLKQRGFKFVGSTICYSYMQAVGMVNDHLISCYRYREIAKPA